MNSVSLKEWYTLAMMIVLLFASIGIAERLRSALKWPLEVTRKFVHIITGVLIFFTPYLFVNSWPLKLLALFFVIINFCAIKLNLFKGMHGTERPTYGTVYYPLTFLILLFLFWPGYQVIVQLSMLILALADALAAIIGENVKNPHKYSLTKDQKSLEGSMTMAFFTFTIVYMGLLLLKPEFLFVLNPFRIFWIALVVSVLVTVSEAISIAGSDNITAPLSGGFVLHFMLTQTQSANIYFTIGVVLALFVAQLSLKLKFLDKSGAAATFLLGSIVFGIGGLTWGAPILAFFISSSVFSKLWKSKKKSANMLYEKSSKRDYGQVVANGGLPAAAILIYYISGNPNWFLVYLASLAAVTADTWATEIGTLSTVKPRLVTTFRQTEPGISGAVSWIGTFGSLLGSLFIALIGFLMQPKVFQNVYFELSLIIFAGVFSSFVDSLLGATIQAQFKCCICNKVTEKKRHCDRQSAFLRGFKWINNDVVNSMCALVGFILVCFAVL